MQQLLQFVDQGECSVPFGGGDTYHPHHVVREGHVGGEHQDGHIRPALAQDSGDLAAVHPRHGIIQHHCVHLLVIEDGYAGRPVARGQHGESLPFQNHLPDLQPEVFIVDAQDDWT